MVRRGWTSCLYYAACQYLSRITAMLAFDYRAFGTRHVPRKGGAVIASNHQSYLDPWLAGLPLPRRSYYLARESLFRFPGFGRLISSLNALPIPREGAASRRAIELGRAVLRAGEIVTLFPEGTRSRDGRLGRMKRGIDLISRVPGAAVVPVYLDGSFEVWPRDRGLTLRPVRSFMDRPLVNSAASAPGGASPEAGPGQEGHEDALDADLVTRLKASYRRLKARAQRVRWAGAVRRGRLRFFG